MDRKEQYYCKLRRPIEVYENYYGCWIIISHVKSRLGYAMFDRNGKRWLIHRWMYQKYYGTIPEGMCICHKCDNPGCVNPKHLFMGTHKQNTQDALKKGRMIGARGETNSNAKLNEKKVKEIRRMEGSIIEISKMFGISEVHVRRIKNRLRWKYLA